MTAGGNANRMRRLSRSERGLSEIVGTLMLVVIVVAAATLLAAFVASYQKQLQTEETFNHDKSLESIEILALSTSVSGGAFTKFNFTIASEYVNPSGVLDFYINGNPLLDFAWDNVSTNTFGTYNAQSPPNGNPLSVLPFQQVIIQTCLVVTCPTHGGGSIADSFLPGEEPAPNHYLKFDIFTHLDNDFTQSYLPPTPLPVVTELNPSGNNPITLLDGSASLQPGGNASIVNWAWTVSGLGLESLTTSLAAATFSEGGSPATNGALGPGVVSGIGATATFAIPPGFTYGLANFTIGTNSNLTISGTGTCTPLSKTWLVSGQTESLAGTVLTVTFPFSATIPAGCSAATLGLSPTGVDLNVSGNAVGEEYEVSPALGVLDSPASYAVTLTVTNSDGLAGTSNLSYEPPA